MIAIGIMIIGLNLSILVVILGIAIFVTCLTIQCTDRCEIVMLRFLFLTILRCVGVSRSFSSIRIPKL